MPKCIFEIHLPYFKLDLGGITFKNKAEWRKKKCYEMTSLLRKHENIKTVLIGRKQTRQETKKD